MTCECCNDTHIIHEFTEFGYRTSGCPECGPEPDDKWQERIQALATWVKEQKAVIGS